MESCFFFFVLASSVSVYIIYRQISRIFLAGYSCIWVQMFYPGTSMLVLNMMYLAYISFNYMNVLQISNIFLKCSYQVISYFMPIINLKKIIKLTKCCQKKSQFFFPVVQLILLQMINLSTIILETQQHQHIHETLHAEPVIP